MVWSQSWKIGGGEEWRKGWKRWEGIGPCPCGGEDAHRFEDIF
ncbi:hypothetical protein HanOQP8_Chr00c039g0730121 [Helianthus annuus]|nr:hypothetical protein HanOQP8_Chr00c039g0730121 [Helianthus annuus]